ncbi:MAG TPA: peptidylprolyl isomerase, partial [Polyangia bacterium]
MGDDNLPSPAMIEALRGTWAGRPGINGEPRGAGRRFRGDRLTGKAPPRFRVKFVTTKGPFVVEVKRANAPLGADRFYNLVRAGYYDQIRFHRVIKGAFVQFGIHGDPDVNHALINAEIPDDEPSIPNLRGTVAFASLGEDTRRAELVINLANNPLLDEEGLMPFGQVVSGLKVLERLRSVHTVGRPMPVKGMILLRGNA